MRAARGVYALSRAQFVGYYSSLLATGSAIATYFIYLVDVGFSE